MVLPTPERFHLLHQTQHLSEIEESKLLRVSARGGLGNGIYATFLRGEDTLLLGGHSIALAERQQSAGKKSDSLVLTVERAGNFLTNNIERLGFGRLYYEAHLRMERLTKTEHHTQPNLYHGQISEVNKKVALIYSHVHSFLVFMALYPMMLKRDEQLDRAFDKFVQTFNALRDKTDFLNNIFFEAIKDYILLHQDDKVSKKLRDDLASFNMGLQYDIFFELSPKMKDDWNTSYFSPSIPDIIAVLKKNSILKDGPIALRHFKANILEKMSYYIHIRLLEGARELPDLAVVRKLDDLASQLPNLAGNIVYFLAYKNNYDKGSTYFGRYLEELQKCWVTSLEQRNIHVAIKRGFFANEEVAVYAHTQPAPVVELVTDIGKNAQGFLRIKESRRLPVSISLAPSKNSGFTRSPQGKEEEKKSQGPAPERSYGNINDPFCSEFLKKKHRSDGEREAKSISATSKPPVRQDSTASLPLASGLLSTTSTDRAKTQGGKDCAQSVDSPSQLSVGQQEDGSLTVMK